MEDTLTYIHAGDYLFSNLALPEQLQGTNGGNYHIGADLQLSFLPPAIPPQQEQMEAIRAAESADAPSAAVISQAEIDAALI